MIHFVVNVDDNKYKVFINIILQMCGIIGYIGTNVQVNKLIVSLKQIQNR